jgi:hypothetical protein
MVGGFENHDLMAAHGRNARRLKAGRAGTDDNDLTPCFAGRNVVRHGQFTTGRWIVDAIGRTALVDPV